MAHTTVHTAFSHCAATPASHPSPAIPHFLQFLAVPNLMRSILLLQYLRNVLNPADPVKHSTEEHNICISSAWSLKYI